MAAAVDKSEMRLEFGKIPVIDMRDFSQDEINSAAESSDVFRFDDIVIPKLDYSTFNESAGSSNQTYPNVLLSQSKEGQPSLTRRKAGLISVSRQRNALNENERKEACRIIELIQQFLQKGEHAYKSSSVLSNPHLNTASSVHNLPDDQKNSSLEAGNSLVVRDSSLQTVDDVKLENRSNADGDVAMTNTGLERAKKRIRTKEGARRMPFMNYNGAVNEQRFPTVAGSKAENTAYFAYGFNKLHGKAEENSNVSDDKAEKEGIGAPANNVGINVVLPLVSKEPVVQLKRKFAPLATEAELQEFFNNIGGQWASNMKRRKIVDAEDFGEGFPKGWKLLLGVRKKHGKFMIECRKYISPDGSQFASCRDVSTYLSNMGNSSVGDVAAQGIPCHAESSDDLQNAKAGISVEGNIMSTSPSIQPVDKGRMLAGLSKMENDTEQQSLSLLNMGNSTEQHSKDLLNVRNNTEQHSLQFESSSIPNMENSNILQRDGASGILDIAGNAKKRQNPTSQNTPMHCKKCNVLFSNRSTFMAHLTIHHVKKKKVVADKTIADGVIMTDGKYECQICHKVFDEKNRYTGHVGVHARKNVNRPLSVLYPTVTETNADLDDKEASDDTGDGAVRAKENVKRLQLTLDQRGTETKADMDVEETSDDKQEVKIQADIKEENLESNVSKEQDSAANSYLTFLGAEGNGLVSSSIGGFLGGLDSDSGKANFNAEDEKFDAITDFGKISMYASVPKFSFEAGQDTNCDMDASIELDSYADVLQQVGVPPEQFGWDPFSSQFTVCVWCNNEFRHDIIDEHQQDGSVGRICPRCKTKSG